MLEGEGWEARGASTPRSRLDGTLAFLQNQFQELMEDKVGVFGTGLIRILCN